MFLYLAHTKFDVYKVAGELLVETYRLMAGLPSEEKYNLVSQIKRAALSVKLNIAEGASRKSIAERKRFYEIARGSLVELDTAIDVCVELRYLTEEKCQILGSLIFRSFSMLSKMIGKAES